MRVKLVIDNSMAGRKDSEVISTSIWTLSDQVCLPPGPGVLVMPGMPWASVTAGHASSASKVSSKSAVAQRAGKCRRVRTPRRPEIMSISPAFVAC